MNHQHTPQPRLCIIQKVDPTEEFGFNLHAERTKGQFIGKVDADTPASRAGLKQGDRIVAVNGKPVANQPHKSVVARIKEDPVRAELLVIDESGLQWYESRGLDVFGMYQESAHHGNGHYSQHQQQHRFESEDLQKPPPAEPVAPPLQRHSEPPPPALVNGSSRHDRPRPRLCRLRKLQHTDEFGFNLRAERNHGHFIGSVDADSIGRRSGLIEEYRIVGVNRELIYPTSPHEDVVRLIRENPLRADLLIASPETDEWYRSHGEEFSFDYAEDTAVEPQTIAAAVHVHQPISVDTTPPAHLNGARLLREPPIDYDDSSPSPAREPTPSRAETTPSRVETTPSRSETTPSRTEERISPGAAAYKANVVAAAPPTVPVNGAAPMKSAMSNGVARIELPPLSQTTQTSVTSSGDNELDYLFNLSATELRDRLATRKKHDPRVAATMTLQEKYEIARRL